MADKDRKAKKQSGIARYFNETSGELRKVSWPTRQEALQLTGLVLIVMIAMALLLGLVDFLAGEILKRLLGL